MLLPEVSLQANDPCAKVANASYNFYVDDCVIYCWSQLIAQAFKFLQSTFDIVQTRVEKQKLLLNADKSKATFISNPSVLPDNIPSVQTVQGDALELVASYKYLGLVIDGELSFKAHMKNLASKLRLKLGFYYRNKAWFSLRARKFLISATFLPVLNYGDAVYMGASTSCLQSSTPLNWMQKLACLLWT